MRLDRASVEAFRPDLIVSYGYRFKVDEQVLAATAVAVNVHISLLPWNGGADPNLWSWLTNTPKGVSLHWMSKDIDRGDLLGQVEVPLDPMDTLSVTYDHLQRAAGGLLEELWPALEGGIPPRSPMPEGGSYHRSRDKYPHLGCLDRGWETPCHVIRDYGRQRGLWLMED